MSTTSAEHETSADNAAAIGAEAAPEEVTPPAPDSPGSLLRAARERVGMSIGDVATRLRMGIRQIDALERGEYAVLPTGTFLRGFVRNYAKAVNADGEQAIRLLEHNNAEAARLKMANIIVPSQEIHIRGSGSPFVMPKAKIAIFAGVALLLAGAAWYWWEFVRPNLAVGGRPVPTAVPATATARPLSAPSAPIESGPAGDMEPPGNSNAVKARSDIDREPVMNPAEMAGLVAANAVAKPSAGSAITAVPSKPPLVRPATAGAGSTGSVHVLGFTFSGDSWVEVSDANGRILLSRQYQAGDAGEVRGAAPLSVVIGFAKVTRMADNGKEIDLTPYTRVSVARVTVK